METNKVLFFTTEQGGLLIRLVIAFLISEFLLQTSSMKENKKLFSYELLVHAGILFLSTALLGNWWLGIFLTLIHIGIDMLRINLEEKFPTYSLSVFLGIQLLHFSSIVLVWAGYYGILATLLKSLQWPLLDYKVSLILLGYLFVTTPLGQLIKYAIQNIPQVSESNAVNSSSSELQAGSSKERGGKAIGIFERIIILTFVLLGQYEAIGFLITGKSIIRFANQDEHIRSEYVLVGTMMSYSLSIMIGVIINYLLKIS